MSPGESGIQLLIRIARGLEQGADSKLRRERDEARAVARNYQEALSERKVRLLHNDITIERWDEQEYAEARQR